MEVQSSVYQCIIKCILLDERQMKEIDDVLVRVTYGSCLYANDKTNKQTNIEKHSQRESIYQPVSFNIDFDTTELQSYIFVWQRIDRISKCRGYAD